MSKGLYKRGNTWWIAYAGPDGEIVRESSKSNRKADAEVLYIRRKGEVLQGSHPGLIRKREEVLFKRYVEESYLKIPEVAAQKSISQKTYILRKVCRGIGHIPLQRITAEIVKEYLDKLAGSAATKNRHLAAIKHVLRMAAESGIIKEEAALKTKKVKMRKEGEGRIRYLTAAECSRLLEQLTCHDAIRDMVQFAVNTGLRRGSIEALRWDHVNFDTQFIHLPDSKSGSRLDVPVNQAAVEVLQRRHKVTGGVGFVFWKWKYADRTKWMKALTAAEITDFRFHDLRHTFISHLVMAGADIVSVQRLAGHKTLKMTLRYTHLAPDHLAKAAGLINF